MIYKSLNRKQQINQHELDQSHVLNKMCLPSSTNHYIENQGLSNANHTKIGSIFIVL
jgi:hypothetical protein